MRAVTSKTLGPTFGMYSHGMIAPGGELVVVAGQVGADRSGKLIGPGDVVAQTRQAFENAAYEQKPSQWKMCFRAGKEATGAARATAQAWLKELGG